MTHAPAVPAVQRQIVLPLSKAVEIAYKSIRLRLSRSLLVTSGIVLALAFLMSILASDAITAGMRNWARDADNNPYFVTLKSESQGLNDRLKVMEKEIRAGIPKGAVAAAASSDRKFDPKARFGQDFAEMQKELAVPLPAPADELTAAITLNPALADKIDQWREGERRLHSIKEEFTGPQRLQALMKANGVPTTPDEIASQTIQTRWLIGLALLVAFVGILNAMLMSVTERFREIGTMKCLGALDSFIIKLFLIESLFQGVVGTIIGIAAGVLLSLAGMASSYGGYVWKGNPGQAIAVGVATCMIVGVGLTVAGAVYPAWQAARMQPIEAMRSEA